MREAGPEPGELRMTGRDSVGPEVSQWTKGVCERISRIQRYGSNGGTVSAALRESTSGAFLTSRVPQVAVAAPGAEKAFRFLCRCITLFSYSVWLFIISLNKPFQYLNKAFLILKSNAQKSYLQFHI